MSTLRIIGVSGGLNQPSRTTFLVCEILREIEALAQTPAQLIEIVDVGPLLGQHLHRQQLSAAGEAVLALVENADIIVAGSPVYKGAYTGQFKHLFDMLDPNSLVDVPVVLAATGGSDRHTLMTDHTLRPLFSFFRAHTVPTSLYATAAQIDNGKIIDEGLRDRIQTAARQAIRLRPAVNEHRGRPSHAPHLSSTDRRPT
jgi:FMN reductase